MTTIPPPAQDEKVDATHSETAVFAGGCFWGKHVRGVKQVASGYTGGAAGTAQYETLSDDALRPHDKGVRTLRVTHVANGEIALQLAGRHDKATSAACKRTDHGRFRRKTGHILPQPRGLVSNSFVARLLPGSGPVAFVSNSISWERDRLHC